MTRTFEPMNALCRFITWLGCMIPAVCTAQQAPDFRSPLDIDLKLSGCFGELRSNHFHTGLDIKTYGEGKKVYAVADGSLARIRMNYYGYGKALYINHPGGYTSLYAHLSRFNSKLEAFVKEQQYKMQSEEIDIAVPDSLFTFKKGDIIAYSGNTGSSEGPHLHFEIRDTRADEALNPLLYKSISVTDTRKPYIYGIKVYPINAWAHVSGEHAASLLSFKKDKYGVPSGSHLSCTAYGKLAIGVHTNDYMNEGGGRNGIYSIRVSKGGKEFFSQRFDRIDFATNRFINTYMDEDEFHRSHHIHKCYKYGNNPLKLYGENTGDGFFYVNEGDTVTLTIVVADGNGNESMAWLKIIGEKKAFTPPAAPACMYNYHYNDSLELKKEDFMLNMQPGTVYDSACINITSREKTWGAFTQAWEVDGKDIPLQEYYSVGLKIPAGLKIPEEKLLVATQTKSGGWKYNKSIAINGYVMTQVREWGAFALVADTVAPNVTTSGFIDSMVFSGNKKITFTIRDYYGLETVNAYIDGAWVLLHYDHKKGLHYLYATEPQEKSGYHTLELVAVDHRDNKTTWKGTIKIP